MVWSEGGYYHSAPGRLQSDRQQRWERSSCMTKTSGSQAREAMYILGAGLLNAIAVSCLAWSFGSLSTGKGQGHDAAWGREEGGGRMRSGGACAGCDGTTLIIDEKECEWQKRGVREAFLVKAEY